MQSGVEHRIEATRWVVSIFMGFAAVAAHRHLLVFVGKPEFSPPIPPMINVGVEMWGMQPVAEAEIAGYFQDG